MHIYSFIPKFDKMVKKITFLMGHYSLSQLGVGKGSFFVWAKYKVFAATQAKHLSGYTTFLLHLPGNTTFARLYYICQTILHLPLHLSGNTTFARRYYICWAIHMPINWYLWETLQELQNSWSDLKSVMRHKRWQSQLFNYFQLFWLGSRGKNAEQRVIIV